MNLKTMAKAGRFSDTLKTEMPLPESVEQTQPFPQAVAKNSKAPSRVGKKTLVTYVDPEVSKQVKILCAERDTTQEKLVIEAINDLLQKYGKPRIA